MKKRNSIKKKLFQIIMVSTLACVLVSVVISLVAVYSVEQQQIQSSMRFGLSQIRSSIDQEYLGLMNVMRGLEAGGDTGSAAENFLEEKDGYQKAVKKQILDEQISDVLFLNLNVRAVPMPLLKPENCFLEAVRSQKSGKSKPEKRNLAGGRPDILHH